MESGPEEKFTALLAAAGAYLTPLGFKKRRQSFRRNASANAAVIDFQRSTTNGPGRLLFTLNIAVLSAAVAAEDGQDVKNLGVWNAHLRARIGSLTGGGDKWWTIESRTDAHALAEEVIGDIRDAIMPYLDAHSSDPALRRLWETGQSPGLTNMQRQRCLAALCS